jgi:hypothetical protein
MMCGNMNDDDGNSENSPYSIRSSSFPNQEMGANHYYFQQ